MHAPRPRTARPDRFILLIIIQLQRIRNYTEQFGTLARRLPLRGTVGTIKKATETKRRLEMLHFSNIAMILALVFVLGKSVWGKSVW